MSYSPVQGWHPPHCSDFANWGELAGEVGTKSAPLSGDRGGDELSGAELP